MVPTRQLTSPSPRLPSGDLGCQRKAVFTNLSAFSIDVTATEITFTNQSQTATVAPGQTVLFEFDVGLSPKPPGEVLFDLGWTDGFPGTESFTVDHSATNACGPAATAAATASPVPAAA